MSRWHALGDGQVADFDDWNKRVFEAVKANRQGLAVLEANRELKPDERATRLAGARRDVARARERHAAADRDPAAELSARTASLRPPADRSVSSRACGHQWRPHARRGTGDAGMRGLTPDEIGMSCITCSRCRTKQSAARRRNRPRRPSPSRSEPRRCGVRRRGGAASRIANVARKFLTSPRKNSPWPACGVCCSLPVPILESRPS